MTIKVLERREYVPPVYQVKCPKCTSVLEYGRDDVKTFSDQRDQRTTYSIDCPVCKMGIPVNNKPVGWQ
jgi:hypothetical protein